MAKKKESVESQESIQFDCLAITEVKVFPFKESFMTGKMKGLASVTINDQLTLRGLRIMDGINGMFVSYPLDPFYKGEDYRSLFYPTTQQFREHVENCVLEKYHASLAK